MLRMRLSEAGMAAALALLLLAPAIFPASILIYENGGCGHCGPYVQSLVAMLEKNGRSDYVIKDFMADVQARAEMEAIQENFSVPLAMRGHMLTLIDGKYLFEGHVPPALIESYMKNSSKGVIVTQDKMEGAAQYQLLGPDGRIETCQIGTPIQDCTATAQGGKSPIKGLAGQALPAILAIVGGGALFYAAKETGPAGRGREKKD